MPKTYLKYQSTSANDIRASHPWLALKARFSTHGHRPQKNGETDSVQTNLQPICLKSDRRLGAWAGVYGIRTPWCFSCAGASLTAPGARQARKTFDQRFLLASESRQGIAVALGVVGECVGG